MESPFILVSPTSLALASRPSESALSWHQMVSTPLSPVVGPGLPPPRAWCPRTLSQWAPQGLPSSLGGIRALQTHRDKPDGLRAGSSGVGRPTSPPQPPEDQTPVHQHGLTAPRASHGVLASCSWRNSPGLLESAGECERLCIRVSLPRPKCTNTEPKRLLLLQVDIESPT